MGKNILFFPFFEVTLKKKKIDISSNIQIM